jgi:hypothetical protein
MSGRKSSHTVRVLTTLHLWAAQNVSIDTDLTSIIAPRKWKTCAFSLDRETWTKRT